MVGFGGGDDAAAETIFGGVRFFLSGFDRAEECQFADALEQHGAINVGQYSAACSHVIVSRHTYDDPICAAARKDGKALVTKSWVQDSLENYALEETNSVLYMPVRDPAGIPGAKKICVCLTGYQSPFRQKIEKMVILMGASFMKPLDPKRVSHLVCYKFQGDKYMLAVQQKLKLVNHRWIEDCLRTWSLLDEAKYNMSGHELELAEAQERETKQAEQPETVPPAPPPLPPEETEKKQSDETKVAEAEADGPKSSAKLETSSKLNAEEKKEVPEVGIDLKPASAPAVPVCSRGEVVEEADDFCSGDQRDENDVDSEATTQICEREDDDVMEVENATSKLAETSTKVENATSKQVESSTKATNKQVQTSTKVENSTSKQVETSTKVANATSKQAGASTKENSATKLANETSNGGRKGSFSPEEDKTFVVKKRKSIEATTSVHEETGEDTVSKRGRHPTPSVSASRSRRQSNCIDDDVLPQAGKRSSSRSRSGSRGRVENEAPLRSTSGTKPSVSGSDGSRRRNVGLRKNLEKDTTADNINCRASTGNGAHANSFSGQSGKRDYETANNPIARSLSPGSSGSGKRINAAADRASVRSNSGSAHKDGEEINRKTDSAADHQASRKSVSSDRRNRKDDANHQAASNADQPNPISKADQPNPTSKADQPNPASEARKEPDVVAPGQREKKSEASTKQSKQRESAERRRSQPKPVLPDTRNYRFALSGQTEQKRKYKLIIRSLQGHVCRDDHSWKDQTTHCVMASPLRRTEKLFAAMASGRWILKYDYLEACARAGRFVSEGPYEWYEQGVVKDGTIDMEAPRKWRKSKQETGCGAFQGTRVIICGDCVLPSLETMKRAIKAGGGTMVAVAPPYTTALAGGVDFAIVGMGIPRDDPRLVEILQRKVACVKDDFFVEMVCNPTAPLKHHILFETEAAVKAALNKIDRIRAHSSARRIFSGSDDEDGGEDVEAGEGGDREAAAAAVAAAKAAGEEYIDRACSVCNRKDDEAVMLFCDGDGCEVATHTFCLEPPLADVPEENWYCCSCSKS